MKKFVLLKYCKLSFFFIFVYYDIISSVMKILKEGEGVIRSFFIFVCLLN